MRSLRRGVGLLLFCLFGMVSAAHAGEVTDILGGLGIAILHFVLTCLLALYTKRALLKFVKTHWERSQKLDKFAGAGLVLYLIWFLSSLGIWSQQFSNLSHSTSEIPVVFWLLIAIYVFDFYGFFILCNYYLTRGSLSEDEELP